MSNVWESHKDSFVRTIVVQWNRDQIGHVRAGKVHVLASTIASQTSGLLLHLQLSKSLTALYSRSMYVLLDREHLGSLSNNFDTTFWGETRVHQWATFYNTEPNFTKKRMLLCISSNIYSRYSLFYLSIGILYRTYYIYRISVIASWLLFDLVVVTSAQLQFKR